MPDKGTSTTDAPDDAPADEVRATDAPDAPDALREAFILAPTPAAGARNHRATRQVGARHPARYGNVRRWVARCGQRGV